MEDIKKVLRDRTISLHAKAMYAFMQTMDGSIDPYRLHLYIKESSQFVEKALKELKIAGYLTVKRTKSEGKNVNKIYFAVKK